MGFDYSTVCSNPINGTTEIICCSVVYEIGSGYSTVCSNPINGTTTSHSSVVYEIRIYDITICSFPDNSTTILAVFTIHNLSVFKGNVFKCYVFTIYDEELVFAFSIISKSFTVNNCIVGIDYKWSNAEVKINWDS